MCRFRAHGFSAAITHVAVISFFLSGSGFFKNSSFGCFLWWSASTSVLRFVPRKCCHEIEIGCEEHRIEFVVVELFASEFDPLM